MGRKQMEVPGTELPSYPDVDAAAEKFIAHRRSHSKSAQKLRDFKLNVVTEMKKVKLTEYRDDDCKPPLLITIKDDAKVHVKEVKHEDSAPKKKVREVPLLAAANEG